MICHFAISGYSIALLTTLMMLLLCHKRVLLFKFSFFSSPAVFSYVVFCRASNWFGRSYKDISSQFNSTPQNTHEVAPPAKLNARVCVCARARVCVCVAH